MSATAIVFENTDIKQNFNDSFQIKHNLIIQYFIKSSEIFSQVYIEYVILNILNEKQEKEFDRLVVLEKWLDNFISLFIESEYNEISIFLTLTDDTSVYPNECTIHYQSV